MVFLKNYVNLENIQTPIEIWLRTAWRCLINWGIFIGILKRCIYWWTWAHWCSWRSKGFSENNVRLRTILVKFDSKGNIKDKIYPDDCQVKDTNCQPVIVITHDECTFSANNRKIHGWQRKKNTFFRPKKKARGIIVSDFLLLFFRLNLFYLSEKE